MNVLCICFDIPGYGDNYKFSGSEASLHDGDLIFYCPTINRNFSAVSYEGKHSYSETDSYRTKKDLLHWQNEIDSAAKSGKTVVIILDKYEEFILHTGARNQKEDYHNYKFLSGDKFRFTPANGTKIKCTNVLFNELYSQFKDLMSYKTYIEGGSVQCAFTTMNGEKQLGGIIRIGNGNIIMLPYIKFETKENTKVVNGETVWTSEAVRKGKLFVEMISKIAKSTKSDIEKTPPPEWLFKKQYVLIKESNIEKDIAKNELSIQKMQNATELLKRELEDVLELKDLLFASGKQLENAVIKALKLMGYQAENYNDGSLELDQVILSPEGQRFIGECEGKENKDIDITKFRQLIDSLNEDFARDEITERAMGILFGNPQRLLEPSERNLDFTVKCKNAANREKVALIRTSDLYHAAKYLFENTDPDFQKQCRQAVFEHLGEIVVFPAVPLKKKTPKISKQSTINKEIPKK